MKPTVLLVEDDALWAKAVEDALTLWAEIIHIGTESLGRQAVQRCSSKAPDIIILDLRLPDISGIRVIEQISETHPNAKFLFFTCRADDLTLSMLARPYVTGMLWKMLAFQEHLRAALRAAISGEKYFPPEVLTALQRFRSDANSFPKILSAREQQLISIFAEGHSDEYIAGLVGLSRGTVHVHRQNIMAKLNIHTTRDLILWAQKKGFTDTTLPAAPCLH